MATQTLHSAIDSLLDLAQVWHARQSPVWGIPTGFSSIDVVTGGLHEGEVTILAARTSHGKTSLASQIAFQVAMDTLEESVANGDTSGQVLIFSPEMTAEQLLLRQACQFAHVPSYLIQQGRASAEQRLAWVEALEGIRELAPVMKVVAGRSLDVSEVVSAVDSAQHLGPPVRLVLIDYIQRLTAGVGNGGAYDRASRISLMLKDMANSHNIPVVALSQLNRGAEKRGKDDDPDSQLPQLTDLRDSGRIEEDADSVWLLHRPNDLRRDGASGAQAATLIVAKNRNGPTAVIPLYFEAHLTKFTDGSPDRVTMDGGRME